MRVAQLHEARGLVGGVGVDRAAEVRGLLASTPTGRPSMRDQRGHDAGAEAGAQLEQRAGVGERRDDRRGRRRRAARFAGSSVAQRALVAGSRQSATAPWKNAR